MTITLTDAGRNTALTAARSWAGLLATMQLSGVAYFMLINPDEAVWVGPWVDAPVIALMVGSMLLKLATAVAPGVAPRRRIVMGFVAVALATLVNLVKIPVYDEPEGLVFVAFDAVLAALLLLAWRSSAPTTVRHTSTTQDGSGTSTAV